jgi:hypothetical protein
VTFLSIVLLAFALLLLVPTMVFVVEVAAGCLLPAREIEFTSALRDRRVAVLIPAHNEGAGIKPTIDDVKRQLRPGSSVNQQVAQFAWRVKNFVRPLGLRKLNLPCQLMGTGMAFPLETRSISKPFERFYCRGHEARFRACCPGASPALLSIRNRYEHLSDF